VTNKPTRTTIIELRKDLCDEVESLALRIGVRDYEIISAAIDYFLRHLELQKEALELLEKMSAKNANSNL